MPIEFKGDFQFTSVSGRIPPTAGLRLAVPSAAAPGAPAAVANPLGALALLVGTWKGTGFNQIWRPNNPAVDRFLELNETLETLEFTAIPGDIPNRGLFTQGDINLHGVTYLQQVQDANVLGPNGQPAGIHIEPGIWVHVPPTTNPLDPETYARMATVPHGTSFVAQGSEVAAAVPPFPPVSITPFTIGNPGGLIPFPNETTLAIASPLRTPATDIPHVTQQMVDNPNSFLVPNPLPLTSTTTLQISTQVLNPPTSGGGTSNIAFLQGAAGGPNAQAVQIDATFRIETFLQHGHVRHRLQYSQRVLLNFNGLSWPHVSVATLIR